MKAEHKGLHLQNINASITLETLLLEFNAQFVPSYHGAVCVFLTFLQVFNDDNTTNDTKNDDSDKYDNDVSNSTIFRMCCLALVGITLNPLM